MECSGGREQHKALRVKLSLTTVVGFAYHYCRKTGILVFGSRENSRVRGTVESLKANEIPHKKLSASEVCHLQRPCCSSFIRTFIKANEKYSEQLSLPSSMECVFEEDGGILMASKAVNAYQVFMMLGK